MGLAGWCKGWFCCKPIRISLQTVVRTLANTYAQVERGRAELAKAESKIDSYRKETGAEAMKKIDQADKKIEEGAAKAKSGISSWFGGK